MVFILCSQSKETKAVLFLLKTYLFKIVIKVLNNKKTRIIKMKIQKDFLKEWKYLALFENIELG